ncbi:GntR family transcriptional regulator [Streptomyces sp. NBC_01474]|uniref:GntR family transcriptional regulator n=1 Tax=unclassified Streptomyces TaxID=2593676 RepID=UPI002DD987B9|nr:MULTISPECIES: GntR family transcriptional regulator [unclassified Streptomyces]WSD97313.1 GntR family transcriptional regulator [Streptomyces sp. NBC_01474]
MADPSPRGTYLVIADALRARLSEDDAPERLPSENDLIAEFDVSRGTVRRALQALKQEGLIEAQHGAGWRRAVPGAERRTLVEQIEDMMRAEMTVGEPFLSEAKLCERFNVSRVAVRSALGQLHGRGLLEAQPGKPRLVRALPEPRSDS